MRERENRTAGKLVCVSLVFLAFLAFSVGAPTTGKFYPASATGTSGTSNMNNVFSLDDSYATIGGGDKHINVSGFPAEDGVVNSIVLNVEYSISDEFENDRIKINYFLYSGSVEGETGYNKVPDEDAEDDDVTVSLNLTNDRNWTWQDIGNMTVKVENKKIGGDDEEEDILVDAIWLDVVYNRAPVAVIDSPVSGDFWSGTRNITWNVSDKDGDIVGNVSLFYSTDGSLWSAIAQNTNSDGIYGWDTSTVSDNLNYTIRIDASDGQLESANYSGIFAIDNSPPAISVVSLTPNIIKDNSMVNISTDGADPQGVKSCTAFIYLSNGTQIKAVDDNGNLGTDCSHEKNVSIGLGDGTYLISVRVRNMADMESWASASIIIDDTRPELSNFSIEPNIAKVGENVTISMNIKESNPDTSSASSTLRSVRPGFVKTVGLSGDAGLFTASFDTSGMQAGKYLLDFYTADRAGNSQEKNSSLLFVLEENAGKLFFNNSLEIPKDKETEIGMAEINSSIALRTRDNVSGALLWVVSYNNTSKPMPVAPVNRFVDINIDEKINSSLEFALIKIYYNISDIISLGMDENTLRIYRFDEDSDKWVLQDGNLIGGVNTAEKYVWANVSHFSLFGVGGQNIKSPDIEAFEDTSAQGQFFPATITISGIGDSIETSPGKSLEIGFSIVSDKRIEDAAVEIKGVPDSWLEYDKSIGVMEPGSKKELKIILTVPETEGGKEYLLTIAASSVQSYDAEKHLRLSIASAETPQAITATPALEQPAESVAAGTAGPLTALAAFLSAAEVATNLTALAAIVGLFFAWYVWYERYKFRIVGKKAKIK